MTIDDYRIQFGWSKARLAREADVDMGTLKRAIDGGPIYRATAGKIANAVSNELQRQGQSPIKYSNFEGLTFAD